MLVCILQMHGVGVVKQKKLIKMQGVNNFKRVVEMFL